MRCWSCGRKIPKQAKVCKHCEAPVESPPTKEEVAFVEQLLDQMDPEMLSELSDTIEQSSDGEDFLRRVMVGDCPKCGSGQTGSCEEDPDIEDICVGRCFACGQLWCLDCDTLFGPGQQHCQPCSQMWEHLDQDGDDDWDEED